MSICLLTRCWRWWAAIAAVAAAINTAATAIAATATGRLPYGSVKPLLNSSTITKICWRLRSTRGSPENCTLWNPIKCHDLGSSNIVSNLAYNTKSVFRTRIINNRWPALPPFSWLYNWRITVSTSIGAGRRSTGWRWSEPQWPAWSASNSTCTCAFRWWTFSVSSGCAILTGIRPKRRSTTTPFSTRWWPAGGASVLTLSVPCH